jgi:hypothetical protein
MNPKTLYWLRRLLRLRKKETPEAKAYREYFSKQLLEHQISIQELYDPNYKVSIPKDPEIIKALFPHFEDMVQDDTASEVSGKLSDEELVEKTWGRAKALKGIGNREVFAQRSFVLEQLPSAYLLLATVSVLTTRAAWRGGWFTSLVPIGQEKLFAAYLAQARDGIVADLRAERASGGSRS